MTVSDTDGNFPIFSHANRKRKKKLFPFGQVCLVLPIAERSTNLWLCMSIINCLRDWQEGAEKNNSYSHFHIRTQL